MIIKQFYNINSNSSSRNYKVLPVVINIIFSFSGKPNKFLLHIYTNCTQEYIRKQKHQLMTSVAYKTSVDE